MSPTKQRDKVFELARVNTSEALEKAEGIADPWFRCQALAYVARFACAKEAARIVPRAFKSAFANKDAYRTVAGAAWPVRALVELGETNGLPARLDELLEKSNFIEHPISRLEALFLLWQAAFPFADAATERVFDDLVRAWERADSWKAGARAERALLVLASRDRGRAVAIAAGLHDSKYKQRLLTRLSEGLEMTARPFF